MFTGSDSSRSVQRAMQRAGVAPLVGGMIGFLWRFLLTLVLLLPVATQASLRPLNDGQMSGITGQSGGLFVADKILPNSLANPAADGSSNYTFYRIGLDTQMNFNANISKLQLGCGGINDALNGPGCDIDIDYASFMGINSTGDGPGAPLSNFSMTRPFIAFAIKNDTSPTSREVVGLQIGAQDINGALSLGRNYPASGTNSETGQACNASATTGSGVVGCNSGINSVSGALALEMSAGFKASGTILSAFPFTMDACFGRINFGNCSTSDPPFFVVASGTRMTNLHVAAAKLNVSNINLGCTIWNWIVCEPAQLIANGIITSGYGQLVLSMKQVHYLLVPHTSNFFLSFQAEPVSWPNYSKAPPPNNIPYDVCNSSYYPAGAGQASQPGFCTSGYSMEANTGWWLNAPGAKVLNVTGPTINVGNVSAGTAFSLFGPAGQLIINDPKLSSLVPAKNCYGAAIFC